MNSAFKKFFPLILLLFCFASAVPASTPEPPAMPRAYVVDLAGIISDNAEIPLNALLKELEQKTTAQVIVLTVRSLDGEAIESFSLRTAEKWKLGQKGKDNGVLVAIALNDRKYRFEVGYGLESVLPDSLVGTIGRQYLVPYFRQGDYSSGINAATVEIIRTIAAHEGVQITQMPAVQKAYHDEEPGSLVKEGLLLAMFLAGVVFIFLTPLYLERTSRRKSRWWGTGFGGFGGGSFGGFGGFGGGSSGGFGGGGGGGFGGGGASGSW